MAVIIDKCINPSVLRKLNELGIKYYKSANIDLLYEPVNTHPDMQIHFTDEHTAVVAPSVFEYYEKILPKCINLIKGQSDPGSTYPRDCAYNVVRLGKKIIGNLLYADEEILKIYSQNGFEFIDVRQGYTKCNLCIVDSNSVITEDEGLFRTLSKNDIDVLKLSTYEVQLRNFKNGFIGGASGFLSQGQLGFFGKISEHTEFDKIKTFISKKNIDIIELSTTKMQDFGSMLYLKDF